MTKRNFAICIKNTGHSVSLKRRKIYKVLPPKPNDPVSMIRIIDESGEDYLFPAKWFVPVELPGRHDGR